MKPSDIFEGPNSSLHRAWEGAQIKASIEHDPKCTSGKGLYLFIDRPDMAGSAVGAISEDELIPIMEAIREYIKEDINKLTMEEV